MPDSNDYLMYRITQKNDLLREAMEKLNYTDHFDYERAMLAHKIEEHLNEQRN